LRKNYSDEKDWYLKGQVGKLYGIYQEKILEKACTSECHILIHCSQCQISLITSKSNQGRKDIGCFFGCRHIHKKKESDKRSTEYNKSPVGKSKKKVSNQKRKKNHATTEAEVPRLPPSTSIAHEYIRLLLMATHKRILETAKINQLIELAGEELRQHPLDEIMKKLIFRDYG